MSEDARAAFRAGALWWATLNRRREREDVESAAERKFPGGATPGRGPVIGTWPPAYAGRAFVAGAKWQEYEDTGATMWQSDQSRAEAEALRRYPL